MRICSKCGESKDDSLFFKDKRKPGGLRYSCKACDTKESAKAFKIKKLITLCRDNTPTTEQKNVWDGVGLWSKHYDRCVECNETIFKHKGNGVCSRCYSRLRQSPSDTLFNRRLRARKNSTGHIKANKLYYKRLQSNYEEAKKNKENETPQVKNLLNSI